MPTVIDLTISPKIERQCRAWCRRWFPREAYGLLLGTMAGSSVVVDSIWLPPEEDARKHFHVTYVDVPLEWAHDIEEEMEDGMTVVVGDFHSHTYRIGEDVVAPVQSDFDIDNGSGRAIFGICNVVQSPKGKLRTSMRWWGPSVKVQVNHK